MIFVLCSVRFVAMDLRIDHETLEMKTQNTRKKLSFAAYRLRFTNCLRTIDLSLGRSRLIANNKIVATQITIAAILKPDAVDTEMPTPEIIAT